MKTNTPRELTKEELDIVAGGSVPVPKIGSTITGEGRQDLSAGNKEGATDFKGFVKN
jgi:hypothetical protein